MRLNSFNSLVLALSSLAIFTLPVVCQTSVLVPLYVYPSTSSTWQPLLSAIAKYPQVTFYVIVNPNSGPGSTYCPDSSYGPNVAKLNAYKNVYTLGYIDTAYTKTPISSIYSQINTYANWTYSCSTPSMNVSMAGIFFDDATNSTTSTAINYMKNASSYAYANVPSDVTPVVFNPGEISATQYFNYADFIVQYESPLSTYQNQTTINQIQTAYRPQSAIIVYNTTTTVNLNSYVHTMIKNNIGAVYFAPDNNYQNLSLVSPVAAAVAAG